MKTVQQEGETVKQEDIHINVLYNWMIPELVLENLRVSQDIFHKNRNLFVVNASSVSRECYNHCARFHQRNLNEDELNQRYNSLQQGKGWNVFSVLAEYGQRVLEYQDDEPLCKQRYILEWNEMSHDLGQDLFTCSFRAREDVQWHLATQYFAWVPIIRSDDRRLQRMMQEGIAENHFHLNGSLEVFSLAWGFLMNHPNQVERFFANCYFLENRQGRYTQGVKDNQLSWKTRIYYAAWIRAYLFQKMKGVKGKENAQTAFLLFDRSLDKRSTLARTVEQLRFLYGYRFPQLNAKPACLDYAITSERYMHNTGMFRFLAGERGFLYDCFRDCFSNRFGAQEKDLFYLYLLLQIQMRQEMIQSNDLIGFSNFSSYQDRKALEWGDWNEYWAEGRRMAINGALHEKVNSLELRVMPKPTPQRLKQSILADDAFVDFAEHETGGDISKSKYFYVLHFAKQRDGPVQRADSWIPLNPRNYVVRRRVYRQTMAIAQALKHNQILCTRIRGIDACSHEIGCRPETFATEFRFLRSAIQYDEDRFWETRYWPSLGVTYHVGEDFLDMPDGLRAIDECVRFLGLKRNDRLGHALVLGIEPQEYYSLKAMERSLPKQDALDNWVWLLNCCVEWKIKIPDELNRWLSAEATQLLKELYGPVQQSYSIPREEFDEWEITLSDYYNSWKLRGDHPDIYNAFREVPVRQFREELYLRRNGFDRYQQFGITPDYTELGSIEKLDALREKRVVRQLMRQYHYDRKVRERGRKTYTYTVSPDLVSTLKRVQDEMMARLADIGIGIECNPSSNKLIGTFGSYEKHPIFRFNHYGLPYLTRKNENAPQMFVSINTDDQGVFGTSLENEYALIMGALQAQKDAEGRRIYSDDQILFYLDHVRRQGGEMVFSESSIREPGRYCSRENHRTTG